MLVCFFSFCFPRHAFRQSGFRHVILQVVPILLQVSEMPPIQLKMLALISASTQVYGLICYLVIYLLETGPCYLPARSHTPVVANVHKHQATHVTSSTPMQSQLRAGVKPFFSVLSISQYTKFRHCNCEDPSQSRHFDLTNRNSTGVTSDVSDGSILMSVPVGQASEWPCTIPERRTSSPKWNADIIML